MPRRALTRASAAVHLEAKHSAATYIAVHRRCRSRPSVAREITRNLDAASCGEPQLLCPPGRDDERARLRVERHATCSIRVPGVFSIQVALRRNRARSRDRHTATLAAKVSRVDSRCRRPHRAGADHSRRGEPLMTVRPVGNCTWRGAAGCCSASMRGRSPLPVCDAPELSAVERCAPLPEGSPAFCCACAPARRKKRTLDDRSKAVNESYESLAVDSLPATHAFRGPGEGKVHPHAIAMEAPHTASPSPPTR